MDKLLAVLRCGLELNWQKHHDSTMEAWENQVPQDSNIESTATAVLGYTEPKPPINVDYLADMGIVWHI